MTINDREAEFAARRFLAKEPQFALPIRIEPYLAQVGATLHPRNDLGPDEAGFSFHHKGKWFIAVNSNDSDERQRFTVCHEIAHIELGLPSEHGAPDAWGHVKRTPNEMYCDIFASELLLPSALFKPLVDSSDLCFARLDELSVQCLASVSTVGSRAAALSASACAFVFSATGTVRYAVRSTSLRAASAWIAPRTTLPAGSASARAREGSQANLADTIEADLWFSDWTVSGTLTEEARHLPKWDQTLTLLTLEEDFEIGELATGSNGRSEPALLEELDGILPWPGRRRRK